jgi:hypothetical protein
MGSRLARRALPTSLYALLNECMTPMDARLLRMQQPLIDRAVSEVLLDAVEHYAPTLTSRSPSVTHCAISSTSLDSSSGLSALAPAYRTAFCSTTSQQSHHLRTSTAAHSLDSCATRSTLSCSSRARESSSSGRSTSP